jgi:hypothetical protein
MRVASYAGTSTTSHGFGSSGSVTATANATASLFLGFNSDISLAGAVQFPGQDSFPVNANGVATITVPFDTLSVLQPDAGQYLVAVAFSPTDDATYLSSSAKCTVTVNGPSPSPSGTSAGS